ncbi:MAG TPA: GNAT family N-acetyltransferase [Chitinolyticbacter sp.]|nr:GNAT family N-acetyltransferase [Chitinolyticbacter sp.]
MPDMLVRLYDLPPLEQALVRVQAQGVEIRRGLVPEKHLVADWAGRTFGPTWQSECEVGFGFAPPTVFVATRERQLLGFACYDTTAKGLFGPTGVDEAGRGQGIGTGLLLMALHAMRANGYAYAVIGSAGPVDYYRRTLGAMVIEHSEPGLYAGMLWG